MTVAEAYLVFFAAINTADSLFEIWLAGSLAVNAGVYCWGERFTAAINTWVLLLYCLFAAPLIARWGIALNKVLEVADLLRNQGESLPQPQVSALFGMAMILFVIRNFLPSRRSGLLPCWAGSNFSSNG